MGVISVLIRSWSNSRATKLILKADLEKIKNSTFVSDNDFSKANGHFITQELLTMTSYAQNTPHTFIQSRFRMP